MKDLLSRLKSMFGGGAERTAEAPVVAGTRTDPSIGSPLGAPVDSPVGAQAGTLAGAASTLDPAAASGDMVLVNAYCTVGILPPMTFPHGDVARRDLSDPELAGTWKASWATSPAGATAR